MMTAFGDMGWPRWAGLVLAAVVVAGPAAARGAQVAPDRVAGVIVDRTGRPVPAAQVLGAFDDGDDLALDPQAIPRTTTDAEGRFDLNWPGLDAGRGDPSIWVVHPGHRLARGRLTTRPGGGEVRVVLDPEVAPAAASVEVLDPRGAPVASAVVVPTRWFEGGVAATSARTWQIPREVGRLVAGRTDAAGRVVLPAVAALRLSAVVVESPLGVQVTEWDESLVARHRVVKLGPVGRVAGQVRGEGGGARLEVRLTSRLAGRLVGVATARTDEAGRFEADHVVAGEVEARVAAPPGDMALVGDLARGRLDPGGAASLALMLRRGVRVRGRVVERGAGGPVAGAWVAVVGRDGAGVVRVQADAEGRFGATTLAGPVTVRIESTPGDFLTPPDEARPVWRDVAVGLADYEWPPLELDRGAVVRGQVRDESGRAVGAGVAVEARWSLRAGREHAEAAASGWTDADGRFAVGPVGPTAEVTILAHRPGDRAARRTIPAAGPAGGEAVEIRLPPAGPMIEPSGRVVDATGRPVAGALVQFRVADPGLAARGPRSGRRIAASGLDAVVTDDQGRYHASGRVDARHRYLASAEAADCEAGRTRVFTPRPASSGAATFPDLVVDRHAEPPVVVGRVVAGDGKPVAGAEVADLAHHRATTDAAGWFQLEKVGAAGPTCLTVQHPGYRFFGRTLSPRDGDAVLPIIVTLARRDEPAAARGAAERFGSSLARDLVRKLARSLVVEPLLERILAVRDGVATADILEHFARLEPARVVGWLGAGLVADVRVADGLRRIAARRLAATDFAGAEAVLAAIEEPVTRCRATLEALDAATQLDPGRKRERVGQVERLARAVEDPERRVVVLARVAESWLNLGDRPRAEGVMAEASVIAATLPRATAGARAWCALIEPLARFDPAQARRRLESLPDPADLDRCRLAIALRSARSDPAEAVRAFRQVRDGRTRLRATSHLCFLLGPVAPELARGLVDATRTAHPMESAHALGMLAAAQARTDRPAATATLDEAFARLEAASRLDPPVRAEAEAEPAAVAAALLPIVEAVDPALLPEFFWRAVSLRPVRHQPNYRADAMLAVLLDRYDPAVARVIFDPTRTRPATIAPADLPALLLAATQLAPQVALDWADHPGRSADGAGASPAVPPAASSHLALIAAWAESDRGRWQAAVRQYLDLWSPDEPLGL